MEVLMYYSLLLPSIDSKTVNNMNYDNESLLRRIEELLGYMIDSSSEYGPNFQNNVKAVLNPADTAEYLMCKSIPVMEIKCSMEFDDIHNRFFCNRVVAYFNAHLRDTRFYSKYEYDRKRYTYKIMVVCD